MKIQAAQIQAVFFNENRYIDLCKKKFLEYEPATTEDSLAQMQPNWLRRRADVRRDLFSSLMWTATAALISLIALAITGKISPTFPLATGKLLAAIGTWLAAWPTWFALANIEDTWDMDSRVDLEVRTSLFKLIFFPGMAFALIGAMW